MKSFKSYISEEVLPTANVENGNFDLETDAVRAEVNAILAGICSRSYVTPYVALRKISKALAYFSIILPKRTFLEGDKGVEVYEIKQFGDRIGMTDQGEFVKEVPVQYHLFFQFNQLMGMFSCTAKVVDKTELDKMLDMAEVMMKECWDKATQSQRTAIKEPIHTDGNNGSPSTKKAMDTSDEKSAKVDKVWPAVVKEAMSRKQKDMAVRRFMSHDPKAGESILAMGKKEREEKKSFASAEKEANKWQKHRLKEDNLDEVSKGAAIRAYGATQDPDDDGYHDKTGERLKGHIERKFGKKAGEHAERHAHADHFGRSPTMMKADDKLPKKSPSSSMRTTKSGKLNKQDTKSLGSDIKRRLGSHTTPKHLPEDTLDETRMPASVIAHKQKLASMSPEELKKKFAGKSEEHLKSMARRHGYGKDSDVYSKHVKEDNLDEGMAPIKKSYGMRKMKKKVSTQVKQGLGVEKGRDKTILVTNKGDPAAAGGGGVHRIPRSKYDPTKHNMASE